MKPGDSCWVWCSQACMNTGRGRRGCSGCGEGVLVDIDANFAAVRLENRERPYPFLACEVFPTREALCEHYRKVFE